MERSNANDSATLTVNHGLCGILKRWQLNNQRYNVQEIMVYTLFYTQRFFSTQPQCCWTFWWIELQILLKSCLIHISIIILSHFLYLLYMCPCLDVGLFMSYLCDLCFFFLFIFIMTNRIIWWIQTLVRLLNFWSMYVFFGW